MAYDATQSPLDKKQVKTRAQSGARENMRLYFSERIDRLRTVHNLAYPYFRNRTITDYVEDSVKRFSEYKERPAYKQDWQANLAGSNIRDKCIGILSKLASQGMEAQVLSTGELSLLSMRKERVCSLLLKGAGIKNDDDYALVMEMLEALMKGTVVGFESWRFGERKVRDVIAHKVDGSVEVKERILKDWNDVWGCIIPLEDCFFGNMYVNHIQKMQEFAWRQVITFDEFKAEFGEYTDADLVLPRGSILGSQADDTIFRVSTDLDADEVELFRYFDRVNDRYVMMVNDIWINPLGASEVQPLIWSHKKLPIWSNVFEPLASNFICGKSLPDKMIANSDYQDKFLENILDRLTLALNAPLVAPEGASSLTDNYLTPNNVITYPMGATSVPQSLDIKEPSAASFNVYQLLEGRINNSSVSAEVSAGGGTANKTATQVSIERSAALELVSLFLKLMEFGIRDKYRLRFPNILQFYSMPIHKKDKEIRFKKVLLRGEGLLNGRVGDVMLEFVPKVNQDQLTQEGNILGDNVEKIQITPDFVRDFEAEIQIVPSSSVKMNKTLRQAVEANWQTLINNLYPDLFNREAGFEDLLISMDKDPDKYKNKEKAVVPGQQSNPMQDLMSRLTGNSSQGLAAQAGGAQPPASQFKEALATV